MSNNPYPVGPGWWHLLDLEIPQLYEIDLDLTGLEIKEKYFHSAHARQNERKGIKK